LTGVTGVDVVENVVVVVELTALEKTRENIKKLFKMLSYKNNANRIYLLNKY